MRCDIGDFAFIQCEPEISEQAAGLERNNAHKVYQREEKTIYPFREWENGLIQMSSDQINSSISYFCSQ